MEANKMSTTCLGAVAPLVWGTTYLVTTQWLPAGHPMTAAVLRAVPAGLLLVGTTRQWPQAWGRLIVLSLLNIGAFFPLLFVAAYRLPGGLASVVGAGQPFVAALAAWVMFRRPTPTRPLAWASIAVVGVAIAMLSGTFAVDVAGVVAAVAGTTSMAVGITLTRAWGSTAGLSGRASTGWQLLLGGLMIVPLVPLVDRGPFTVTGHAVLGYAWLSVIGGALAYAVWLNAARRLPATSTSLLSILSPVTAAALGWVVLGQALSPVQIAGFGLALVACVFGQHQPRMVHAPREAVADRSICRERLNTSEPAPASSTPRHSSTVRPGNTQ